MEYKRSKAMILYQAVQENEEYQAWEKKISALREELDRKLDKELADKVANLADYYELQNYCTLKCIGNEMHSYLSSLFESFNQKKKKCCD